MKKKRKLTVPRTIIDGIVHRPCTRCGDIFPEDKETALLPPQTLRKINRLKFLFRNGPGRRGETMWDWFSAVTYYVSHEAIVRGDNTLLESSWWGTGCKLETKARNIAKHIMTAKED